MKKVAISRRSVLLFVLACACAALAWVAPQPSGPGAAKPPPPALGPGGAKPPPKVSPVFTKPGVVASTFPARGLGDRDRCNTPHEAQGPRGDFGGKATTEAEVAKIQAAHKAWVDSINEARRQNALVDIQMMRVSRGYPRPRSEWRAGEKAAFENLLAKGQFDVLVVPFQVQLYAVDRATRSLMTALLAASMAAGQQVRIPDPYLVARALGDGERCLAQEDIARLAQRLGVKRVIHGYVGHDRAYAMRLTLQIEVPPQAGVRQPWQTQHFEEIQFSDEKPPLEAYVALLPAMLKFVGGGALPAPKQESASDDGLPKSPIELTTGASNPARDALAFQLLAALTPRYGDRTRERLTEKSLLAIQSMSPSSPEYTLLKARALMQLGLRPAAIAVLGTPQTAEGKHLLAMLNGNLPEAEAQARQIRHAARALIAWLEINQMRAAYKEQTRAQSIELARSLKLPGDAWAFLAVRAMTDWDDWSQHENIALKSLLDVELPVAGFTAQGIVRGAATVGDIGKARLATDLSVLNHSRRLIESSSDWCCAPLAAGPTSLDYLDLIESIATDNLVRRAKFLSRMQGRPENTLEYLAGIESGYKNHPQVALARADAEARIAARAEGASKDGLARTAYAGAINAWYWEQGQTPTAADAWGSRAMGGRQDYGHFDNFYASDYPFRAYYPDWEADAEMIQANLRAKLKQSTSDLDAVRGLVWQLGELQKKWDQVDELFKSIDGRFAGHPGLPLLHAKNSLRKGDLDAAEKSYGEALRIQPDAWEARKELGTMLFERAQITKSAELFTAYPGFKKGSTEHSVAVSNHAYEAGSLFYWSGNFAQAAPLYRISADLQTGSESSLSSAARVALMEGDLATAMAATHDRLRRYQSAFAYRDYMAMLHAAGRSSESWDAFNSLVGRVTQPQIWESVLVGHRLEGKSEAEIATWAGQDTYRKSAYVFVHAAMYALRASVTDRAGTDDLAARIAALDRPVWLIRNQPVLVVRPSVDGQSQHVLGPDAPRASFLPSGVFDAAPKTQIKTDLVRFAEAYRAIRKGDFAAARPVLEEAVSLFDPINVNVGYLLPYFAYASVKSGETSALQTALGRFGAQQQRFDYHLANALLQASGGKSGDALQSLRLALHRRPYTESRPLMTEYQLAEVAEWIYEMTRDAKIKEFLLGWAKANQTFQPWHAWAYAVEAKHAPNGAARTRAIAIAHYLDRNSERLAGIPRREVDAAVKEFSGRNPFLQPKSPAAKKESA
jgi:hypothetical protein